MSNIDANTPDEQSPWTQPWFIASAVVVLVIVLLGVWLTVTRPDEPAAPQTASEPTASSTPSSGAPKGESTCGLPAGDQTVPVLAPDTEWELVAKLAVPTAPEGAGPGRVDDGLRTCFSRDPLGALYASVNLLAMTTDPATRTQAAETLLAPGPGREEVLRSLSEPGALDQGTGPAFQVAGFTFLNYDRTSASIDLALQAAGRYVHFPITMRWVAGDWKALAPISGQIFESMQPLPELTGYVAWNGA